MKLFWMITASVCMLVLTGCMSVNEPDAPALTGKFLTEANLHLEGFQLYSVREKQHRVGNSVCHHHRHPDRHPARQQGLESQGRQVKRKSHPFSGDFFS